MKHALVFEDNHLIAMMIEDELLEYGNGSVEITTTGEQAVEMARVCFTAATVTLALKR